MKKSTKSKLHCLLKKLNYRGIKLNVAKENKPRTYLQLGKNFRSDVLKIRDLPIFSC